VEVEKELVDAPPSDKHALKADHDSDGDAAESNHNQPNREEVNVDEAELPSSLHEVGDLLECTEEDRYGLAQVLPNGYKAVYYRAHHSKSGISVRPGSKVARSDNVFLFCAQLVVPIGNEVAHKKKDDCCGSAGHAHSHHGDLDVHSENDESVATRSYTIFYVRQVDVDALLALPQSGKI